MRLEARLAALAVPGTVSRDILEGFRRSLGLGGPLSFLSVFRASWRRF